MTERGQMMVLTSGHILLFRVINENIIIKSRYRSAITVFLFTLLLTFHKKS